MSDDKPEVVVPHAGYSTMTPAPRISERLRAMAAKLRGEQRPADDFLWNLGSAIMFGALVLASDVRSLQRIVLDASCSHRYGYCRQCTPSLALERKTDG